MSLGHNMLSCSVMSDSATPVTAAHQALLSMGFPRQEVFYPWDFPGKNTWVGCHFLLQGIFPAQGLNSRLLHYKWILYPLSHLWSHKVLHEANLFTSESSVKFHFHFIWNKKIKRALTIACTEISISNLYLLSFNCGLWLHTKRFFFFFCCAKQFVRSNLGPQQWKCWKCCLYHWTTREFPHISIIIHLYSQLNMTYCPIYYFFLD